MIKMSKASKMPCKSWSLQAIDTCIGAFHKGTKILVDTCKDCYAMKGMYRFPVVKAARAHNRDDWKRDGWVSDMVKAIGNDPFFRWFDSGDVYHIGLLRKIFQVMEDTPNTMHWMPTRMHKFPKFRKEFKEMSKYDNIVIRWSSDSIDGEVIDGETTSTVIRSADDATDEMTVCNAPNQNGKCEDCRACWNRDVKTIAYVLH